MIILLGLLTVIVLVYLFIRMKYSYWTKMRVKGPTPLPFLGNFGRLMMQKQSISQLGDEIYKQFPKEKFVGMYCGFTPVLLLRDPALINQILTTDFNNFVNRGLRTSEEGFSNNLLICEDQIWRTIRQKLTPAFTGIKLKQMTPLINKCVNTFISQTELSVDSEGNCDIKDLATKYAMELVCSCLFGLSINFYDDEIKEFTDIGKEVITPGPYFLLWYAAEMLLPGIQSLLPMIDPTAHIRTFFNKLVNEIISERKKVPERRRDFMEILIRLLDQDQNKTFEGENGKTELKVDTNFVAGQAFVFYCTGFETSSSTLSHLIYELSLHEDYQENVYREICTVLEKYNGELTYDSVNEMSYLQKVLNETFRRHSSVGWIIRKASKDYMLPETDVNVKAGTLILISTIGLHNDPKYFDNPEAFEPENFSQEKLKQTPQGAYIPFSIGPRNCIGLRFARQHILMAVAAFLRKYKVGPCTDIKKKVNYDSISITLSPVDGVWINVSKRK